MSLSSDCYTARRLEHSTAEHLHLTTRRTFVGPIPEGWLKSHRKQWYRHYLRQRTQRAPTFIAASPIESDDDTAPLHPAETDARPSSNTETPAAHDPPDSTTSLLARSPDASADASAAASPQIACMSIDPAEDQAVPDRHDSLHLPLHRISTLKSHARVRFSEPIKRELGARARRIAAHGRLRSSKVKDGEVLKLDKMLVRIDITQQQLREDYDEKSSQGVETKQMDKWREFVVVCRKHSEEDAQAVVQLYQTRVISVLGESTAKKKPKAEILLSPKRTKVNLFSSLDKTVALWTSDGTRTTIYYLRPQSSATSVEWLTFLHTTMGWKRAQELQVNIPDLNVSLRLADPFKPLEAARIVAEAAEDDDEALAKVLSDEQGVARSITERCLDMLQEMPEWADVLKAWLAHEKIGLAWKRYDRLEWVHGANEQKMYGTIAMQRTHDLELRPKQHYPIDVHTRKGLHIQEPPPVEGFLIRLTSQKGRHEQRIGKLFFKRLYFTTQNQYLLFLRPAKASPPPPPRLPMQENGNVPSSKQITARTPLVYDIDPYPVHDGAIEWLDTEDVKSAEDQRQHDREAAGEAERNTQMLLACDGFINLCDVANVRKLHRGATPADQQVDEGSDVDFHADVEDSHRDDGQTSGIDDDRTFEVVMKNGLVIRLQAYNKATKHEWMKRLRHLVTYWTDRATADMDLYKAIRRQNLHALNIDERAEAVVGQFAYKWEVSGSHASPELYNLCGIAACRTIHMAGLLFRKPRRHATFTRCHVLLAHGHLLVFQDTLRSRSGKPLVHIHHERIAAIDLRDAYLYSGLITENDLLYQNRTFDANTPGHHALPRLYRDDAWTSSDEDAMTTFVVWHARRKAWFKSSQTVDDVRDEEHEHGRGRGRRLTRVSRLGAAGRAVVFKARSRAERDHWVLAVQVELERLAAGGEDVRVVAGKGGGDFAP